MNQSILLGDPATQHLDTARLQAQSALLDTVFPGFSLLSTAVYKYTKIDLSLYIPIVLALGLLLFAWRYLKAWFWDVLEGYLMSTADIRVDDEIYNMVMGWISLHKLSAESRRFVANTNLKSRDWHLWRSFHAEEEDEDAVDYDDEGNPIVVGKGKKKQSVRFTPAFGTHYFWYKNHLLIFKRQENQRQPFSDGAAEQIFISSFGRNPAVLKELLDECRDAYAKNDANRTIIYRGGLEPGISGTPIWTRCVSRVSRPFSTVVLDEAVKKSLLDDMRDYLHPYTRRWYSNRGIPYRRGYLLYGPPGTGKSSLSFAIAGYFKLKIYIVSLNNPAMSEENLGSLFNSLPKQCVVLLEDIDTAGLTHTRTVPGAEPAMVNKSPATTKAVVAPIGTGRISLSALLNILDGVASQEGRVLIMTTNHIDQLDEALIRPGRVDMNVKFDLATSDMIETIFRGIYATLEGDVPKTGALANLQRRKSGKSAPAPVVVLSQKEQAISDAQKAKKALEDEARYVEKKKRDEENVARLGKEFAAAIPAMTFSPAEIQGYLLKHKREPETSVKGAAEWVVKALADRVKEKEKKAKDAVEKAEAEKVEAEKTAKEEEEKEKKEADAKTEKTKLEDEIKELRAEREKMERLRLEEEIRQLRAEREMLANGETTTTKVNGVKGDGEEKTKVNGVKEDGKAKTNGEVVV